MSCRHFCSLRGDSFDAPGCHAWRGLRPRPIRQRIAFDDFIFKQLADRFNQQVPVGSSESLRPLRTDRR
jgi:hypothetical protein